MKGSYFYVLLVLSASIAACQSAAMYRSARTLEPGENELGAQINWTHYATNEVTWDTGTIKPTTKTATTQVIYAPVPEFSYHRGLIPNLEAGARLAPAAGYAELDAKYRFYHEKALHLAGGLAGGVAPRGDFASKRFAVLGHATWDFDTAWSANFAFHVGYRSVDLPSVDPYKLADTIDQTRLSLGNSGAEFGAGVSAEYRSDMGYVRPGISFSHGSGQIGVPGQEAPYGINVMQITLSGGVYFGKENRRANDTQDKLDQMMKDPAAPSAQPVVPPTPVEPKTGLQP